MVVVARRRTAERTGAGLQCHEELASLGDRLQSFEVRSVALIEQIEALAEAIRAARD